MALIAHLSDPHLGPTPPVTAGELMSKRLFGYLNWKRNRGLVYDNAVVEALVADIAAAGPDHVAVTGDLVNLGLAAEFDAARAWLATLGAADDVTVVPGNHDAYVPGAFEALTRAWQPFMAGDAGETVPFVRRRGAIALIGVTTAVATAPLMATGRIGAEQADALGRVLADTGADGLFRIVLIHHPPQGRATHWHRRLTDAYRVRAAIRRRGAELVLHGHNHRFSLASLDGAHGPLPVIGAAAASVRPGSRRAGGSYNLVRVGGKTGAYRVDLTVRRLGVNGRVETVLDKRVVG